MLADYQVSGGLLYERNTVYDVDSSTRTLLLANGGIDYVFTAIGSGLVTYDPQTGKFYARNTDITGSIGGGGGGSTTFAGLTDKTSVDLTTVNTPLSNALTTINSTLSGMSTSISAKATIAAASPWYGQSIYVPSDFGKFETVLSANNVVLNGSTDDSANIAASLLSFAPANASAAHKIARFPRDAKKAALTAMGLTIASSNYTVDFGKIQFNCAGLGAGVAALNLIGATSGIAYDSSALSMVMNGHFIGADTDAATQDGISLGGTGPGRVRVQNMIFQGFSRGVVLGSNVYVVNFDHFTIASAHKYGFHFAGTTNAGENISFTGGFDIYNCRNAAGNCIAIYNPASSSTLDMSMRDGSFDYCDRFFDWQQGALNLSNVHLENNNEAPMGVFSYTGGGPATSFNMRGGAITQNGPNGVQTENAAGRAHLFEIAPNAGDRIKASVDGVYWTAFGRKRTQMFSHTGAGLGTVSARNINTQRQGGAPSRISTRTNLLRNGGFELGVVTGWTYVDGGNTLSQDTAVYNTDLASFSGFGNPVPGALGSGYTTAAVTVTGCSGLQITPNIVGGQITSYTKTREAYAVTGTVTLTVTGDGTGATATIPLRNLTSLQVVGVGDTTNLSQAFGGVEPGMEYLLRGSLSIEAISTGTVTFTLYWLSADGQVVATDGTQSVASLSATQAFTLYGSTYRAPTGAAQVKVEVAWNSFTGTSHADDFSLEKI